MSEMPEQTWGLWKRAAAPEPPPAPAPSMEWRFNSRSHNGGTARVYLANDKFGLQRPVILSDGFNAGPSNFDELWHGLNGSGFAFIDELRRRGHDLILLGYDERNASILTNAEIATQCVMRAIAERKGTAPLLTGGFSMGGLVTRYALAKMEHEGIDHQTATYLSFDSPHRGAWIPIGLQALAHFMVVVPALSKQINSPAARQLLWRHISSVEDTPKEDPLRTAFLAELARVGSWPKRPRLLAVANGRGDGHGNGVPAGELALEVTKGGFARTALRTQTTNPETIVAYLKDYIRERKVPSHALPEVDGAPGGMLDSFAIAADNLTMPLLGSEAVAHIPAICFVPTISAVSVLDINAKNLTTAVSKLDRSAGDVDDFICSSENVLHSKMTSELGTWILERLPGR